VEAGGGCRLLGTMKAERTMIHAGAPIHDPPSKRAADLSAAMDRAKAVFIEKGLAHTTADLIAGARIILDPLVESTDLLREVSAVLEGHHETTRRAIRTLNSESAPPSLR
jgi:hypothetical protein